MIHKAAICALLVVAQLVWAKEPIDLAINVSSADPVTATQVRRRLTDALTNIDDVTLVDFNGHYTVNVIALKLAVSSRIKVGYSLSVVVTEPFPPDNVQSLVEPDMQEYAALLMEGALAIRDHYIVVVPGEDFEEAVEDIAKQLDLRILQDYRDKHR